MIVSIRRAPPDAPSAPLVIAIVPTAQRRGEGVMNDIRFYGPDGQADEPRETGPGVWKTRDVLVPAVISVVIGLVWVYGWGLVWSAGRALLPELGFFLDGFYLVGGVMIGYIVRRPGAALLGEMVASLVELPLTPFGVVVLWLGFVQGLGVE